MIRGLFIYILSFLYVFAFKKKDIFEIYLWNYFVCIYSKKNHMKKLILSAGIVFSLLASEVKAQQEYKIVTVIESIVPMGMGRSRIVENSGKVNIDDLTNQRDGNKSKQGEVDREEVKEAGENMKETKLVNFFNLGGINFGNIASNDAVIAAKMNDMIKQGWSVAYITSGVESNAGKDDGQGIFITRIFFVRPTK